MLQVKNYVALILGRVEFFRPVRSKLVEWGTRSGLSCAALHACLLLLPLQFKCHALQSGLKRHHGLALPCFALLRPCSIVPHASIHLVALISAEHFLLGMLSKLRDQPCTNSFLTKKKERKDLENNHACSGMVKVSRSVDRSTRIIIEEIVVTNWASKPIAFANTNL